MTKGERTELRSLTRLRFRVLRAEVVQRQIELFAELEDQITARFAVDDEQWATAMFQIGEAAREANRKANDVMRQFFGDRWEGEKEIIHRRPIQKPVHERVAMQTNGQARIRAQVGNALLALDRQEADMLTRLAEGALESAEAREFLGALPAVSELVPAVRLAELEAQLREEGGSGERS